MHTTWEIKKLRNYLRERPDFILADTLLNSLSKDILIFGYHAKTAKEAFKDIKDKDNQNFSEDMRLIFGLSEKSGDFRFARLISEAHLISCLHTTREMWDHFAQLLNLTVLNKALATERCSIAKITALIPQSELKDYLNSTLNSYWNKYIVAFVNTSKHHRLIEQPFSISFEENNSGPKVSGFTYNSDEFPSYWSTEIIEGAKELKNRIIYSGCLLNKIIIP